jgi:hypothetical protein
MRLALLREYQLHSHPPTVRVQAQDVGDSSIEVNSTLQAV